MPVDTEPDKLPLGVPATVHDEAGRPLSATLAVAVPQVGCVIVPIVGADGITGAALTTAPLDATEVQVPLLTVKVEVVFAVRPVIVPVVAEPVKLPDGLPVTVQLPDGRPVKATLPVCVKQVGCVTAPGTGADGVTGWALTTEPEDADEVQLPL